MFHSTILAQTPHSSEAERTVIGALLCDPEAIYKIDDRLSSEDFYDPIHREIYAAMSELSEKGSAIDFVTVTAKLQNNASLQDIGGSAFLAQLASEIPTASHVTQYADIILEKSRRRELGKIGRQITMLAEEEKKSADELMEMAEQKFLKLSPHTVSNNPVLFADMGSERYEHYATLYDADDATQQCGLRIGLPGIDEKLNGLAAGQFIVIAGRPGMGKTSLALDIAANVAFEQGKVVAFFSLEMTKEEIFGRIVAKRLGVESWKLEKGSIDEQHFHRMGPLFDDFAKHPLYIDDDPDTALINLRSKARRQKMRHSLDLLIIDYLQLIEVTDKAARENQNQRITEISKSLKRLARELHIPVIALSQLSRECDRRTDKRPQLSDLRDSGSIEQDGDRILMLYREGEYNEDCDDPELTDIFIRKNRHGPKGCVELRFNRKQMSFFSTKTPAAHAA